MTRSETVVVVARLYLVPGSLETATEVLRTAAPGILAEDGCLLYAPHIAENGDIVIIERWRDRQALDAHRTGAAVQVQRDGLAPITAAPTVADVLTEVEGLPAGAALSQP